MDQKVRELRSVPDLENALGESSTRPVLLFKHSVTCPISARAYREFESYLAAADPRVSYNLITVQGARPVSDEAAERLKIEHESPQAILVRNGRGVWNASHSSITEAALEAAIRDAVE